MRDANRKAMFARIGSQKRIRITKINEPEWYDKVRFHLNPKNKAAIISKEEVGDRGIRTVRVADNLIKTRNPQIRNELLRYNYPEYNREVSLFDSLSYHGALNRKGRISKYGTHDYNLSYSDFKPIERIKLLNPVKSQNRREFGKIKKEAQLYEADSITLDWRPEDSGTKLWVEHQKSNPLTERKEVMFKSREYDVKDKDKAITLFKRVVEDYKKRKQD